MERLNPATAEGVFTNLSVDRIVERIGVGHVAAVIDIIDSIDLRPPSLPRDFCLGTIYERALLRFADMERGSEFYVPDTVASLIVRLVDPRRGESVYDPFCRAGQLLSSAARYSSGVSLLAGQVPSSREWSLCKVNVILHGISMAHIEVGDALDTPMVGPVRGSLEGFDAVISNPPFGMRSSKYDAGESKRGLWGGAPNSGDYAYLIHAVESMREGSGRAAIIVSPGVLFRGGGELDIRRRFVEEWIIEAVVALPANLFSATRIPVAIICLRKGRRTGDILFIDATRGFVAGRRRNSLTSQIIDEAVSAFRSFERGTFKKCGNEQKAA